MATILYAEIYFICIIIVSLLLLWMYKHGSDSTPERWLRWLYVAFLVNFAANFCFTVFNGLRAIPPLTMPLSWFFKSVYHMSLCAGVYMWCGYGEALRHCDRFSSKPARLLTLIPLLVPVVGVIANLWTHHIFEINADGLYVRHFWFQLEMAYLVAVSMFFSVPLITGVGREYEPSRRSHLRLTAAFTLCLAAAWLLSLFGERYPVICVCVVIELLCLYVDTSNRQISMDKLTQVNNRQNLLGFLEYKLANHSASMFLLMIDVDYFKDINDTYGHLEGDEALVLVSGVLKSACAGFHRRPYIARYGGDEFIILLEGTREEADGLCRTINDILRQRCAERNKPYMLTLSIGVGRWQPDMDSKAFIAAADSQLYQIKRARTRRG